MESRVPACAVIEPPGQPVRIAREEAIIVWDAAAGKEHFIRQAVFNTSAKDFGFLVPTPSQPEFGEMPPQVFDTLSKAVAPKVIQRCKVTWRWGLADWEYLLSGPASIFANIDTSLPTGSAAEEEEPVRVVSRERVAGYDVVVLRAADAEALGEWLAANNYPKPAALNAWIRPYLNSGWYISAFKYSGQDGQRGNMRTGSVRMSFATDQPFYPYREPAGQGMKSGNGRLLRVYFVGDAPTVGSLGSSFWNANTHYSAPDRNLASLLPGLGLRTSGLWLTALDDRQTVRQDADVYFASAAIKTPIYPPAIIQYRGEVTIPLCLDVFGVVVLVLAYLRMKRGMRATAPAAPLVRV